MFSFCFHIFLLSIVMLFAGQTFSHFPQPTHLSCATCAKHPLYTLIASNGHTFSQAPQATQINLSTTEYLFDTILIPPIKFDLLENHFAIFAAIVLDALACNNCIHSLSILN